MLSAIISLHELSTNFSLFFSFLGSNDSGVVHRIRWECRGREEGREGLNGWCQPKQMLVGWQKMKPVRGMQWLWWPLVCSVVKFAEFLCRGSHCDFDGSHNMLFIASSFFPCLSHIYVSALPTDGVNWSEILYIALKGWLTYPTHPFLVRKPYSCWEFSLVSNTGLKHGGKMKLSLFSFCVIALCIFFSYYVSLVA